MINVLWLCNSMLPAAAEKWGLTPGNKEGWISGLSRVLLEDKEQPVKLSIAFPVDGSRDGIKDTIFSASGSSMDVYGFYEDTTHPEIYDEGLEKRLSEILKQVKPDVVHCFGTEYPHTLAMCRIFPEKDRILIGIQGLCAPYTDAYMANLPKEVIHKKTLRDILKRDTLPVQQEKFRRRGEMEIEAVKLARNITGRTEWDKSFTGSWNPEASYFVMNETLRENFYTGEWQEENAVPHSIFVSQGDYPIKGLHYLLEAMPKVLKKYPDTTVSVAGGSIVKNGGLLDRLKISAYGKYIKGLLLRYHLADKVHFLGKMNSEEMKTQYLKSELFVCPSSIENSPNSLGEAMLLGVPCVTADVGGILSIFDAGKDGIAYQGFRCEKTGELEAISQRLADAILEMFENSDFRDKSRMIAREHAKRTHDGTKNYMRLLEIYSEIAEK